MAQRTLYGIDVGTTKTVAIAGRVDSRRETVEVDALAEVPSQGLKRGVVVDREAAADSIAEAVEAGGLRGRTVSVG
ncbi:MAG: cell division protein FtsA, partial [Rubrobacteraceae bacterium]